MEKFNKQKFLKGYHEELKGIIDNTGQPAPGAGRAMVEKLKAVKARRVGGK